VLQESKCNWIHEQLRLMKPVTKYFKKAYLRVVLEETYFMNLLAHTRSILNDAFDLALNRK